MAEKTDHSLLEDAQGLAYGSVLAAFGIVILTHLGLITGQTAGLAVLIAYLTGFPFWAVFFVINIPFYVFGWQRMGARFTLKTFIAVASLSLFSALIPHWVSFATLAPGFGAILFGFLSGSALLALFRHGASLGGIGILALLIQDRLGWKAGWTQLGFDICLFSLALLLLRDPERIAYSFLGALVVNMVLAFNHRRDRYIAT